jgi:hypothetical protein
LIFDLNILFVCFFAYVFVVIKAIRSRVSLFVFFKYHLERFKFCCLKPNYILPTTNQLEKVEVMKNPAQSQVVFNNVPTAPPAPFQYPPTYHDPNLYHTIGNALPLPTIQKASSSSLYQPLYQPRMTTRSCIDLNIKEEPEEQTNQVKCPECSRLFKTNVGLAQHMARTHKIY